MDYKEKYEMALETIQEILDSGSDSIKMSRLKLRLQSVFPELKKSKDEKIREELTDFIERLSINPHSPKPPKSTLVDCLAWLKKLGEQQSLYIRFGEIPNNEKSKIYCGEEEIGEEDGVSVYPAFEVNGNIVLGLTLPITKTTLYTQQHLLEYENKPCYLVKGDRIGKDADGQPLIRNVQIIKKIDNYRVKEEKADNANGYCIKESGFPYPTKPATFSEHKSDCEHVGCHINGTKRWCHKLQSEVPYEKCSDKCSGYSSKQKSDDELEPTFKVGDWVIRKDGKNFGNGCKFAQITTIDKEKYWFDSETWLKKEEIRFWSINDAKDGDILVSSDDQPFIFNGHFTSRSACGYCGITLNTFVSGDHMIWNRINKEVKPATREQRNILEKSMAEAGYTFDFDKKELNKITKFKIGDWIVEPREDDPNILWHIDRIIDGFYWDGSNGISIEIADKYYYTWSIEDAEDGDVLVINGDPFIYKGCLDPDHPNLPFAYCGINSVGEFCWCEDNDWWTDKEVYPATKEQCNLLFQKMKEDGYEWDAKNKKLNNKKI